LLRAHPAGGSIPSSNQFDLHRKR